MRRMIRKENSELVRTLIELERAAKKHQAPLWHAVAERLARARHQVTPVNVGHLDRLATAEETIVIAGKVLGEGRLTKPVTVAAFHYSAEARTKIHSAGGKALTIDELLKAKPDGVGVRFLA